VVIGEDEHRHQAGLANHYKTTKLQPKPLQYKPSPANRPI